MPSKLQRFTALEDRLKLKEIIRNEIYHYAQKLYYFRVERINRITKHRTRFDENVPFDEGLLRKRSLLMYQGKLRVVRFEFRGQSVQAVLGKLLTARIVEHSAGKYFIEAEVYGDGIKMWLLS